MESQRHTHAHTLERWDRFDWKSCQLIDRIYSRECAWQSVSWIRKAAAVVVMPVAPDFAGEDVRQSIMVSIHIRDIRFPFFAFFFLAGLIVGERSERRVRRQLLFPSANAQWRRWRRFPEVFKGLFNGQRAWNDFRSLRIARDILLALWNQNRRLDLIARTYTARIVTIVTIVRRGRSAEYGTRFRLGFMQKAQVAYLGRCFVLAIGISKFRNATKGPSRFLFF